MAKKNKDANAPAQPTIIELPEPTPVLKLLSQLTLGAKVTDTDGKYSVAGAGVKKSKLDSETFDIATANGYLQLARNLDGETIPNVYTVTAAAMTDSVAGKVKSVMPELPNAEDEEAETEAEQLVAEAEAEPTEAAETGDLPGEDEPLPEEAETAE